MQTVSASEQHLGCFPCAPCLRRLQSILKLLVCCLLRNQGAHWRCGFSVWEGLQVHTHGGLSGRKCPRLARPLSAPSWQVRAAREPWL